MNIVVIDGQGGNIGKQLVKKIREKYPEVEITAVGTNSTATENMIKAGATRGATGENAVVVAAKSADVIVGPIGIVIADALLGEVSPKMAKAVGRSSAKRILIPINRCETIVAGVDKMSPAVLIEDAVEKIGDGPYATRMCTLACMESLKNTL